MLEYLWSQRGVSPVRTHVPGQQRPFVVHVVSVNDHTAAIIILAFLIHHYQPMSGLVELLRQEASFLGGELRSDDPPTSSVRSSPVFFRR